MVTGRQRLRQRESGESTQSVLLPRGFDHAHVTGIKTTGIKTTIYEVLHPGLYSLLSKRGCVKVLIT
jgi:hypothetical protein